MNRGSVWTWVVLLVWGTWIYALVGRLGAMESIQGYAPDLGMVLLLSLQPRLTWRDAYAAALLLGLTRAAFSADGVTAILVGTLAAVAVSRTLGSFLEVEGVIMRTLLAGAVTLAHGAFLAAVHLVQVDGFHGAGLSMPTQAVVRVAVATAIAALVLGPALARLPGLGALEQPRRRRLA